MSTFGDYKAYKKYTPVYDDWKYNRDLIDAKRQEYLRQHPEAIDKSDIQRGKTLLRAIDIMDEYSQKRAEDMEVATETAVGYGLEIATLGGMALGLLASNLKLVKTFFEKFAKTPKMKQFLPQFIPMGIGALVGMVAAFPLYAWAAKIEVGASRKGRFEAMRKDLNAPNGFAILTPEQQQEAQKKAKFIPDEAKENKLKSNFKDMKALFSDNKIYNQQRREFEAQLLEDEMHKNDKISPEEAEKAKKDQQLLTKLVEKIDIASQDYAENAELATTTGITALTACAVLFNLGLSAVLKACKVTSANKIKAASGIASILGVVGTAIAAASLQKEAARVGRFKAKQELLNNPAQFVYVDDSKLDEIKDVKVEPKRKQSMINFLKHVWADNKEYKKYKKTQAVEEKKLYKAIETLELTPEQIEDAKRLQKNTFKTFNKIDENSQRYSESVEALGNAINVPISFLFGGIGAAIGGLSAAKSAAASKGKLGTVSMLTKVIGISFLASIPSLIINAEITKKQKRASRVADMLAINEMQDYRTFRS